MKIIKAYSDGIHSVYTQLVWAETTRIGCAWSIGNELYYLTCNYGNAGNIVGSPVYIMGTQCSKCPTGFLATLSTEDCVERLTVGLDKGSYVVIIKPHKPPKPPTLCAFIRSC
ncbi:hypothetical protein JTB14_015621 [Gonioctena quinquepunctata]|nr:hypothetical protein JTB14_015621 [Gonioctena quinquepunctata]